MSKNIEESLRFHSAAISTCIERTREIVLETQWKLRTNSLPRIPAEAPPSQVSFDMNELLSLPDEPPVILGRSH